MSQSITLDEKTVTMQLCLDDSGLALRALKDAIRKISPQADIPEFTYGNGILLIASPGPVIKHTVYGGYMGIELYHNGAKERTGELINSFLINYLNMQKWVCDN